uniref:U-box domain-containing protein n=1 Tax=Pyrodinium bahamense TaxID=73915 RepID=A0A7S0FXB4_9DINO
MEVIQRLNAEIEELSAALKAPGVAAARAFKLRKELGQRRSERARAERAVRQGRRARKEVKGSSEDVRAILSEVSAVGDAAPLAAGLSASSSPPRFLGERSPLQSPKGAAGGKTLALPPGLHEGESPPSAGSQEMALAILLHPETLSAGSCTVVGRLGLLATAFKATALDASNDCFGDMAWQVACSTLARERALWCPTPVDGSRGHWRAMFFEQLWPARWKWTADAASGSAARQRQRRLGELGVVEEETGRDFTIQVAVRFRPGAISQGRLLVPLHQKLMLERQKGDGAAKIGEKEPPEFLDALMGHVMADPVKLPSSGRICDRRVVEEQLRRGLVDPFDGSHLEAHMLEPQGELRTRIEGWRAERRRQAADGGEKHKLEGDEVRELVERLGGNADLQLVEAVLEAERLRAAGRSALRGAMGRESSQQEREEEEEEGEEEVQIARTASESTEACVAGVMIPGVVPGHQPST